MLSFTAEIVVVLGAFLLGTFEGPRLVALVKGWFVKEEQAVVTKVETTVGIKPPTGTTGA